MPREAPDEPAPSSRTDPRRALAESPLAASLLDAPADPRAGALAHIRARDPRARLEAAAAELHGGRADALPAPHGSPTAGDASDEPRRARGRRFEP